MKLLIGLAVCITFLIAGCTTKESTNVDEEKNTVSKIEIEGKDKKETVINEKSKNTPEKTSKDDLKKFVENAISDEYKGPSYTCDIITPVASQNKWIVSIQLDSKLFNEKPYTESAIKKTLEGIQKRNDIHSIRIMTVSNWKLVDCYDVTDMESFKNVKDVLSVTEYSKIN